MAEIHDNLFYENLQKTLDEFESIEQGPPLEFESHEDFIKTLSLEDIKYLENHPKDHPLALYWKNEDQDEHED
jgi:hypothetical protein